MDKLLNITDKDKGKRLDLILTKHLPVGQSRAYWQKAIEAGYVRVNGGIVSKNYKLVLKDKVTVKIPQLPPTPYDLPILFEDEQVVVFDKPAGLLTHSKGAFNPEPTVASLLSKHISSISKAGPWKRKESGVIDNRQGIVHRLDRDTSGVIIAAKNEATRAFLQRQFAGRKVLKVYVGAVQGKPKIDEALLDWPIERNPKRPQTFRVGINGKPAQTHYKVLCHNDRDSLLQLEPKTGRTHQLRVHLTHLGHPILGDRLYNKDHERYSRLMLHALSLTLRLPDGKEYTFKSPLPTVFEEICRV